MTAAAVTARRYRGSVERLAGQDIFAYLWVWPGERRVFLHRLDCVGCTLPDDGARVVFSLHPADGRVCQLAVISP